jgi:hypothetical protein
MRALDIEVHAHLVLREANELAGDGVSSLVDELVERVLPVGAWQKFSQVSALVCILWQKFSQVSTLVCILHKSTKENAFKERMCAGLAPDERAPKP